MKDAAQIREDLAVAEEELKRAKERVAALQQELALATLAGWAVVGDNVIPLGELAVKHDARGGTTLKGDGTSLNVFCKGYYAEDWNERTLALGESVCFDETWFGFFATREEADAFVANHPLD